MSDCMNNHALLGKRFNSARSVCTECSSSGQEQPAGRNALFNSLEFMNQNQSQNQTRVKKK